MTIGRSRLKELRAAAGLTLEEAAARAGFGPQALQKIERDEAAGLASLGSLAKAAAAYGGALVYDIKAGGRHAEPQEPPPIETARRSSTLDRRSRSQALDERIDGLPPLAFGGLELRSGGRMMIFGNRFAKLRKLQFLTLYLLMEAQGRRFRYESLCKHIWGEWSRQRMYTLRVIITKLRAELSKIGADHLSIESDREGSYRLVDASADGESIS